MKYPWETPLFAPLWKTPPHPVPLGPEDVHVWSLCLEAEPMLMERAARLLSPAEQRHAMTLCSDLQCKRYIAAHSQLRMILGSYTGHAPQELRFTQGRGGKPGLARSCGTENLCFSLAHCGELGLLAVSRHPETGADLERVRPLKHIPMLSAQFFSAREKRHWEHLHPRLQARRFLQLWTQKQALLKAVGQRSAPRPQSVELSLRTSRETRVLSIKGRREEAATWGVRLLIPALDFIAAVAVHSPRFRLHCWHWPEEVAFERRSWPN